MKKIITLVCLILTFTNLPAQTTSTKGDEFWFSFLENLTLIFNGPPEFKVYISAESDGSGTISSPVTGWSQAFTFTANELTEIALPDLIFYGSGSDDIENYGLKLNTDVEAEAFVFHYRQYFSEASKLLPTTALSNDYLITTYLDFNNTIDSPASFVVIATKDNTIVEITPTGLTLGLFPPNQTYSITLNAGESYQVQSNEELTGSRVVAPNGEKIAVFSGALKSNILCDPADSHLYDQTLPTNAAGNEYALVPFKNQVVSVMRILSLFDDCEMFLDGEAINQLDEGEFLDIEVSEASILTTSSPVQVTQFNPSQECFSNSIGDPNMLTLVPLNQVMYNASTFHPEGYGDNFSLYQNHNITLIAETINTSNVFVNGEDVSNDFMPFPNNPDYSFLYADLEVGISNISSEKGVLCYAYGFGDYDGYTYHLNYAPVDVANSLTSISKKSLLKIWPNPTQSICCIESESKKFIDKVKIYSTIGKLLKSIQTESDQSKIFIDFSELPNGLYLLETEIGEETIIEKVLKK